MKRLLDYRRGLLLGAGRAASSCGDQILEITLIWAVWQVTQSSSLTGLAVFIQRAPFWLFGFIGATFTDRLGAIVILRRANLSAVGMAGVATILIISGSPQALTIGLAAFAIGCARAFEPPALTSIVPSIVPAIESSTGTGSEPARQQKNLNNILDNAKRLGRLAAPAPAMLLGKAATFAVLDIAAAAFLVMALAAMRLARTVKMPVIMKPASRGGQLRAIGTIYSSGALGVVLGCSAIYALFHGAAYFSIVPRILLSANGGEAGAYASVIGAFAFGGIVANILIAGIPAKRAASMVGGGMFVAGMSFLLLGQVSSYAGLMAIGLAGGASLAFQDVFIITLIQKNAPSELLARAHALWRLGSEMGLGVGVLLGGIAADLFNSAYLLIGVGAAIALISAALVFKAGRSDG